MLFALLFVFGGGLLIGFAGGVHIERQRGRERWYGAGRWEGEKND